VNEDKVLNGMMKIIEQLGDIKGISLHGGEITNFVIVCG
jgi:hypothetical protein